jgi:hypothetical protein
LNCLQALVAFSVVLQGQGQFFAAGAHSVGFFKNLVALQRGIDDAISLNGRRRLRLLRSLTRSGWVSLRPARLNPVGFVGATHSERS